MGIEARTGVACVTLIGDPKLVGVGGPLATGFARPPVGVKEAFFAGGLKGGLFIGALFDGATVGPPTRPLGEGRLD